MLSQRERFIQWRGTKALEDRNYIDTAELIALYVDSVKNLDMVKHDLKNHTSQKFMDFDRFNQRSLGSIVLFKLVVNEIQAELTDTNTALLSLVLSELNVILIFIYDSPEKALSSGYIDKLFNALLTLTQLNDELFVDRQQAKKLFFTAYVCFSLIQPTLNSLPWYILPLVQRYVDVAEIKTSVQELLQKIEAKAKRFIPVPIKRSNILGERLAHLNQHYLNILNKAASSQVQVSAVSGKHDVTIIKNLDALELEMGQVVANISRLIELRQHKIKLELTYHAVSRLFEAAKANDLKISGRTYFLDLRSAHLEAFSLLLNHFKEEEKALFLLKIQKLTHAVESHALSLRVTYGLSKITSPFTYIYRFIAPQLIQDITTVYMPATLDRECKRMLKKLAAFCLFDIRQELAAQQVEIDTITNQLFDKNIKLKKSSLDASLELLIGMQQATEMAQKVVQAYRHILFRVKENMDFLYIYQSHAKTLNKFICINNNFWVQLSNFFAQFLSIFKTDMAKILDSAIECLSTVDAMSASYQAAIDQELKHIEEDPNVDLALKRQIIAHFKTEVDAINAKHSTNSSIGMRDIRLLMNELSILFKTKSMPKATACEPAQYAPVG